MEISHEALPIVELAKKPESDFVKTAESLGFIESAPMKDARRDAVAYLIDRKGKNDYAAFKIIYEYYCKMGEKIVEKEKDVHNGTIDQAKVQLGFLIMRAAIYYLGGDRDLYEAEWVDIVSYAMGLNITM